MVPVKSSAKQKTHDLSRRKRRGRVSQRAVAAGTTGPGIFATRAKKRLQVMRRVEGRGASTAMMSKAVVWREGRGVVFRTHVLSL